MADLDVKPEETKPAEATAGADSGEESAKSGLSTAARRKARANRARHSKRFTALEKGLSKETFLPTEEGLTKIKSLATAKFDETIETAVNLGVDPRHGDQMVRGTTNLPFGTGKSRVVWVFARGEKAADATAAGADLVGAEDLLEKNSERGRRNVRSACRDPRYDAACRAPRTNSEAENAEPEGGNRFAEYRAGCPRHQRRHSRRIPCRQKRNYSCAHRQGQFPSGKFAGEFRSPYRRPAESEARFLKG